MSDIQSALAKATVIVRSKTDTSTSPVLQQGEVQPVSDPLATSFFEIDHPTEKQSAKMTEIMEWVRQSNEGKTDLDVVSTLKDLRYRLGSSSAGESPLDKIHRYVKLRKQADILTNQAKSMEV